MVKLLLTPGEPAGIGPDLAVNAAQHEREFPIVAVADPDLLSQRADILGLPLELIDISDNQPLPPLPKGQMYVLPIKMTRSANLGQLNVDNAAYVVQCLEKAANLCERQQFDAVVTGPVQKSIINDAGIPFSGHTEYFADHSNTPKVVMMLATEGLRVALATTHLPLRDVADAITTEELTQVTQILVNELHTKFGLNRPKVLVAGLNPHAGEGGHLGNEEIDTIIPVMESFKQQSVELIGPLPADTLFTPKYLEKADAVLAMYHDQGLPVLKHKGFGKAVNITLGLPYIRTSVDHGTALDLAGSGLADPGSLEEAIAIAHELATNKNTHI